MIIKQTLRGGVCVLLLFFMKYAQAQTFTSFTFSPQEDLIDPYIYDIAQDSIGYLWVATGGGLVKYNGNQFLTIDTDSALKTDFPSRLLVDEKGRVYAGYFNGTIGKVEGKKLEVLVKGDNNGSVLQLRLGLENELLALTQQGLVAIDKSNGNWENHGLPKSEGLISDFCLIGQNRFLFTGSNGAFVARLDGKTWKQEQTYSLLNNLKVVGINSLSEETVDIHVESGEVFKLNINNGESTIVWTPINKGTVRSTLLDHEDIVWLAQAGSIKLLNLSEKREAEVSLPIGLRKITVNCFYEDREKTMWVGTFGQGLYRLSPKQYEVFKLEQEEESNGVLSVLEEDSGHLLVGTEKGLLRALLKGSQLVETQKLAGFTGRITALAKSKNGATYLGVESEGVYVLKKSEADQDPLLLLTIEDQINHLMVDQEGGLWVSTTVNGVVHITPDGRKEQLGTAQGMPHNQVLQSFQDNEERIWFATHGGGLGVYKKGKLMMFDQKGGLSAFNFNTIVQKANSKIWFGTEGSGLHRFDGAQFNTYEGNEQLPSKFISNLIIGPQQHLWVLHGLGISKIEYESLGMTNYLLQGERINNNTAILTQNGSIWAGYDEGLISIKTTPIAPNNLRPNCRIQQLFVNDKRVEVSTQTPGWDYGQLSLAFYFEGLSYRNPAAVRYRYRLIGFENNWSEATVENRVIYKNLRENDYVLAFQCTNDEGVWGPVEKFSFVIYPPFWRSSWFMILLGLTVLFSFILIVKWREGRLEKDKKELEQKVKQRTEKIEEQKELLAIQNKEIRESIQYARRIQKAILDDRGPIEQFVDDYFILHLPKDIVSGDFYWIRQAGDRLVAAAVDCTGHGVPGAFMSIIGTAGLKEAVENQQLTAASEILDALNSSVVRQTNKNEGTEFIRDGMDVALCSIGKKDIQFSGAKNPLYILSNGSIEVVKANRFAIGSTEAMKNTYTNQRFARNKGDILYMFSDGFSDQFGGAENKKYQSKTFRQKLIAIGQLSMNEQKETLREEFMEWKGETEQVDDVLVIGIKL